MSDREWSTEEARWIYPDEAAHRALLQELAELAEAWAHQATDYDEDTEQQIADGGELLELLRRHGVPVAEPRPAPKPPDPAWIQHLSHPSKYQRNRDGIEHVPGCRYCTEGR